MEEEQEEVPRASIFCLAGPGPITKVEGFYNLEPSLTDADYLHGKLQSVAEPDDLLGVPTSTPVSASVGIPVGALPSL